MRYDSSEYDPSEDNVLEPPPAGDYDFVVMNAAEVVSKNGNPMIELKLEVDVGRRKPVKVYDYLVSVSDALWKIHNFCECCGLDFHSDELLADDCFDQQGRAHFVLGEPNHAGRQYLKVYRYLTSGESTDETSGGKRAAQTSAASLEPPDDIPF